MINDEALLDKSYIICFAYSEMAPSTILSFFLSLQPQPTDQVFTVLPATMTFMQDLLKPGGGIALIPFIRGTIATLLVLVM